MNHSVLQHYRRNAFGMALARVCLIAVLLWAQSATAQHELDHAQHEATELCQIFTSAEHSKAVSSTSPVLLAIRSVQNIDSCKSASLLEFYIVARSARSPPVII